MGKLLQLFLIRQYSEKKKIRRLFKSEAVVPHKSCCQILDVVASVIQTARAGNFFAVHYFYSLHVRYLRKSCKDALTVYITQTSFYIILSV